MGVATAPSVFMKIMTVGALLKFLFI